MFIAIDPGEHVGVATFTQEGTDLNKHTFALSVFRNLFIRPIINNTKRNPGSHVTWIMEDFTLRKDKAVDQVGSNMPAPRCIGAVELADDILGDQSNIVLVKAGELRGALKWAGYPELANKPRTWHCPDDIAAYAHGVKYLIDQKLRKHPIFG